MAPSDNLEFKVERITPAKAKRWLEHNNYADNRTINKSKVADLVRQMQRGLWVVNGDSIRFDVEDSIIDGQHRLAAVVESGVTIDSVIVRGLPTETFTTIDQGWRRSTAVVMRMQGEKHATTLVAAARLLWQWEVDGQRVQHRSATISPDEVALVLDCHPELRDAVQKVRETKADKVLPGGMAAFACFMFRQAHQEKADVFFERVGDGVNLDTGSPMLVLRERLMQAKVAKKRFNPPEHWCMLVRAWNAFYRSRKIHYLRLRHTNDSSGTRMIETPPVQGLPS